MEPMTPYGQALLDYFQGDHQAVIDMHRDDGEIFSIPITTFFRDEQAFSVIERKALASCQGKILDIGAGSGRHSLYLQQKGYEVMPIDISPEAVSVMKQRGLPQAGQSDIFSFRSGRYDTLLLLLHGIGMAGSLEGFRRFLDHARSLINPGGCILFDSTDVRAADDPKHLAYQERNRRMGRYIGEIHLHFVYRGQQGKPYRWLHIDPDTLLAEVSNAGWKSEMIHSEPWGEYLVRLSCEAAVSD